jgi:hypothetical protein
VDADADADADDIPDTIPDSNSDMIPDMIPDLENQRESVSSYTENRDSMAGAVGGGGGKKGNRGFMHKIRKSMGFSKNKNVALQNKKQGGSATGLHNDI